MSFFAKKRLIGEVTGSMDAPTPAFQAPTPAFSAPTPGASLVAPPTPGAALVAHAGADAGVDVDDDLEAELLLLGGADSGDTGRSSKRRRIDDDDEDDEDDGDDDDGRRRRRRDSGSESASDSDRAGRKASSKSASSSSNKASANKARGNAAGDDSDSDDGAAERKSRRSTTAAQSNRSKARAKALAAAGGSDSSDSESEDSDGGRWGSKSKGGKRGKRSGKKGQKRKVAVSDDEGSDSDDASDSQSSDGSNSSDDGSDAGDESGEELTAEERVLLSYTEDHMGDAADRERLFALSEVDREAVLFERSEKIQALKERQIIRQQLREKAAREGKGRSNRASSSRSKDGKTSKKGQKSSSSSSSSSKKKDKSSSRKSRGGDSDDQLEVEALGERGRNSKSAAQLERERALKDLSLRRAAGSTSQDAFTFAGDRHSDQETDRQRDDGATAMSIDDDQPPEAPLTLDDLNRARLTRSKLEKYVHAPFFAKSIRNCYVRVNIGVSNGQTTYRLAKVAGVEEGKKAYQLGATRTNKLIELDYCGSHRSYRLEYVSNTDFTESEFYKWKDDMAFNRIPLPSLDELRHRSKQIQSMSQHVRTSQVIDAMLQERNRFQKAPEGLAYAKTSLAHEISVLEQQGDPQGLLPGLREKLAETEAAAEENNKKATENLSLVSQINAKNRHKNLSDLGRKASGEKVVSKLDPFERRACRPVMFAFPKEDPNASHATAAPAAPVEVNTAKTTHADAPKPAFEARSYQVDPVAAQKALFGASIGVSSAKAPEKSALPPIRDLFASADLRLDIDVSTSAPVTMPGITPTSAVRRAMPDNKNRTISFADYKQRNGLF